MRLPLSFIRVSQSSPSSLQGLGQGRSGHFTSIAINWSAKAYVT